MSAHPNKIYIFELHAAMATIGQPSDAIWGSENRSRSTVERNSEGQGGSYARLRDAGRRGSL